MLVFKYERSLVSRTSEATQPFTFPLPPGFSCLNTTMETLERSVKSIQG